MGARTRRWRRALEVTRVARRSGLLRVLGVIPFLGFPVYAIASIWMLLAMIVAVRQALDYKSTGRAIGVCVVGWALSLAIAAIIGIVFPASVSYRDDGVLPHP